MGHDQDGEAGQFEWVNTWAATSRAASGRPAKSDAAPVAEIARAVAPTPAPPAARKPDAVPNDQLMRDLAEIERVRDSLAAIPIEERRLRRRTQALTLVPARTTDAVPVVVGGVLALVMLTVFGAAAAMSKLSR